ncbi:unnamed protein product [Urochloa humidicola]
MALPHIIRCQKGDSGDVDATAAKSRKHIPDAVFTASGIADVAGGSSMIRSVHGPSQGILFDQTPYDVSSAGGILWWSEG